MAPLLISELYWYNWIWVPILVYFFYLKAIKQEHLSKKTKKIKLYLKNWIFSFLKDRFSLNFSSLYALHQWENRNLFFEQKFTSSFPISSHNSKNVRPIKLKNYSASSYRLEPNAWIDPISTWLYYSFRNKAGNLITFLLKHTLFHLKSV